MKFNDPFEFVVSVNEIYDTKIEPKNWTIENNIKVGHLVINDEDYFVNLEPKTYTFETKTYSFINISFDKLVNGKNLKI